MHSRTDYAYFAGVIDGEGHIAVRGGASKNQGLILCMADLPVLEWCMDRIGGTLSSNWRDERGNARPRRMWKMSRAAELEVKLPWVRERGALHQELLAVRASRRIHRS